MSISEVAASNLSNWTTANASATDAEIAALVAAASVPLPSSLLDLLRVVNGGEADVADTNNDSDDRTYLVLWTSAEVPTFNTEYEVPVYAPAFVAFGSNGGGELFAFDIRRGDDAVFMIPAIGMSNDDGLLVAPTLLAFARRIAFK